MRKTEVLGLFLCFIVIILYVFMTGVRKLPPGNAENCVEKVETVPASAIMPDSLPPTGTEELENPVPESPENEVVNEFDGGVGLERIRDTESQRKTEGVPDMEMDMEPELQISPDLEKRLVEKPELPAMPGWLKFLGVETSSEMVSSYLFLDHRTGRIRKLEPYESSETAEDGWNLSFNESGKPVLNIEGKYYSGGDFSR